MRISNFPSHTKNKSMNITHDRHNESVFFQNVFDNSQNFKKMAGKNYDKFSKCLPEIKSSIVNIFSSDAQKSRALNYIQKLRNRNNPVVSLRKKMLSQNLNSSFFMENSINTSYVQNNLASRPRVTQYSQYDLSNILGGIDEEGKNIKKKQIIYDNINDEQNGNETFSTDKKCTGLALGINRKNYNKTVNTLDKKEKLKVKNQSKSPINFIKNPNFFQIQKFSIDLSNEGNNKNKHLYKQESQTFSIISGFQVKQHKPKAKSFSSIKVGDVRERVLSPIKTSLLNENPKKNSPGKNNNSVTEVLEKIKLIKKQFSELNPSKNNVNDNKNFTGFIITQVYNGKKIKSYKYLNEDNITEIKGKIKKDDILIGDELFNHVPETTANNKLTLNENTQTNKEINTEIPKVIKTKKKKEINKNIPNKEIQKLKVDNIYFSPKKNEKKFVYVKEKKIILSHESIPESIEEEAGNEISPHNEIKTNSFSQTPRLNTLTSLETNESISSSKEIIPSQELDFSNQISKKLRFDQINRGKFPENIIFIEMKESTNRQNPQL